MRKINNAQNNEIRDLRRMKDTEIDTTDIPPNLDWSKAVVGKFYRPIGQGRGHPIRINTLPLSAKERSGPGMFVMSISDYGEFAA